MKIAVLDFKTLGDDLDLSRLKELGNTAVYEKTMPDEVAARIKGCDVIIVNKIKLNAQNLNNAKNLKLICVAATGFDNIDTQYCRENKIAVCNVSGYSTDSVAQLTVAMVLYLCMHLATFNRYVSDGSYTKSGVANCLTPVYSELRGKTWGIVGYGNIGRQVGKVAKAFGCNILACKRTAVEDVECTDIDTLCRKSDIITVHPPLTAKTRGLISEKRIALMKPHAIVVNVSRGAVVDESALCKALKEGKLGGIGVDVYSTEPFGEDSPYNSVSGLDNVCLTPHIAWGAYESRVRCLEEIIKNITAFFGGERRNRVD